MPRCSHIKNDGSQCSAFSIEGSDRCWFHSKGVNGSRKDVNTIDMSKAIAAIRRGDSLSYITLFGKSIGERPLPTRLMELETFYNEGGLIAAAIDSYVSVLTANGYQFIDSKSGERETESTDILAELDQRINFHRVFEKIARSLLIYGFAWGEIQHKNNKIEELLFLPPYEIEVKRADAGKITEINQWRSGQKVATWKGNQLDDVFFINFGIKHSETYGIGLLQKIYNEAKAWKENGEDLGAITKFVSYPFRVVKVGSDTYPASEASVIEVGNQVENLEPGDWLATRHNVEFEFESPEVPDALVSNYVEKTRQLIVSLGVPSMYTALSDIDAGTLKEIRSIYNSTIKSLQLDLMTQFEDQVIKKQFELLGKQKARTAQPPAIITWNPLTISVISILELTQLVTAGVISQEEARRIIESMGYGLLRGDQWKKEILEMKKQEIALMPKPVVPGGGLKNPKTTHPTENNPNKPAVKPPATDTNPAKTKKPAEQPSIKKPQPNSPKMSFDEWMQSIDKLAKYDPYTASLLLKIRLLEQSEASDNDNT